MPQTNVLRWRDGRGWIILAGSGAQLGDQDDVDLDIEAQALTRIAYGEPIAYIWAAGDADTADQHLALLDEMGAPTGYLVDIVTEDDASIRAQLEEAGMIILGDGQSPETLRAALLGAALEGMQAAYARGAVILGIGAGAAALGSFLEGANGLGWVENAIVMPNYELDRRIATLRALLEAHPSAYGIAIGSRSALALGADGQVEVWGERKVTILLGSGLRMPDQGREKP
ncbi:MAG: Type 1 glutamine amidotransferase-like domain-containing protein [Anaerolineae bacterium]|nr:Type 1 glutamine amidotransferase-like domain-containing protein [Anaerolineae bacterium]MDW8298499.1 Type 1 glutamine amidotransferase-like domain-containing protein [Anaerolineae bacterium]